LQIRREVAVDLSNTAGHLAVWIARTTHIAITTRGSPSFGQSDAGRVRRLQAPNFLSLPRQTHGLSHNPNNTRPGNTLVGG